MKQENYKNLFKFTCSLVVWAVLTTAWGFAYWHEYRQLVYSFGLRGSALFIALYGALLYVFTSFYGGYRIGYYRRVDLFFSGVLGLVMANLVAYVVLCLVARHLVPARPLAALSAVQVVLVWLWSLGTSRLYRGLFPPRQMLLVYGGDESARSLIGKMISRSEKYSIQEAIHIQEGLHAVCQKILEYRSVILCDLSSMYRNRLLKFCFQHSIRTYTTPKISDILIRGAININLFDTPLLLNRNNGLSFEQRLIKRIIDLLLSAAGLLLLWPLMLLAALLIKLYDGGPVFFKQQRCTIGNRVFTLVKFRSMVPDAERDGISRPAVEHDPRITPIGRVLRATRLDELPQLWNILRGDMSLVGPRPERIEHVRKYTEEIPEFVFRSKVKAGLTGYAQVVGRYNTSAYDKLKMDLMYIAGYSLAEDFKLILMTVKILFKRTSTQGFEQPTEERNQR